MRWNAGLATVVLIASLAGCHQQKYMTEADANQFRNPASIIPANLESDLHQTIFPSPGRTPPPMTVNDLGNRTPLPIQLKDCIAVALEQGNVGVENPLNPGFASDQLVSLNGRSVSGSDAIRVFALEPADAVNALESTLARFDARWVSSMTWNKQDQAANTILTNFSNGDTANFTSALVKPLATGGLAGITFGTEYLQLSQPPSTGVTNPSWRPRMQFVFEQPLLQFFGVEINQLRGDTPGSIQGLVPRFQSSLTGEGILISRIRVDQARAEFERRVNVLLLNVEYAYWNLYSAYYTLFSREQGLKQALVSWQVSRQKLEAGLIAEQDLQQVRGQYEDFRGQHIQALGQVLQRERNLRGLMGLPLEDGRRLVPIDAPTLDGYVPDWASAENEAMSLRPELILARQDLKSRQLDLIARKNLLKPDLRFFANYDINGLGTRLDGGPIRVNTAPDPNNPFGPPIAVPQPGNALASLTDNEFNSWQLGLRMDVSLGYRDANAAVSSARLNLQRSYILLKDQERKVTSTLGDQYRSVIEFYELIGAQRANRQANARQVELRFQRFLQGARGETIDVLLEAQRNLAAALASEYVAIANYNSALAGFHFAKGTIMQYDNVNIAEGALPNCAQVRAVEHFRQRAVALQLRERADPSIYEQMCDMNCMKKEVVADNNLGALPISASPMPAAPVNPNAPPPRVPGMSMPAGDPLNAMPPRLPEGR